MPPERLTAHGQGCTNWAVCAADARGIQKQQLLTTGRGRYIWLKNILFQPALVRQLYY